MKKILLLASFLFITYTNKAQELVSSTFLEHRSVAEMQADFGPFMQWAVDLYKITYTTPDLEGVMDTASGLVVVPVGIDRSFPLLCAQHGTVGSREDVPSNLRGGYQLAVVYAGVGYVAAAPDFLGLGESRGFHPYVHAESEASASVDMLFATRELASTEEFNLNDQLFVMGYSQGGHAAAALHRKLEQEYTSDFTVTASAPMSGPYSISGEMRKAILSDEEYFFPGYLQYTSLSYNEVYGLYEETEDFFKQPYADMMEQFYNEEIDLGELNGMLITQLQSDYGASITKYMIQDSVLQAVETNENHPVNVALRDNDVYDWTPVAPTRFYYCEADEQVAYRNSILADSVMNANGAEDVQALSMGAELDHGGCVEPAITASLLFFGQYQDIGFILDSEEQQLENIDVYPNPAKDELYIQNNPEEGIVEIIASDGRISLRQKLNAFQHTLDVKGIPAGIYWLKLTTDQGNWIQRIMINN